MRHHRPTAGQPNPCIEFAKCQNDNPAIMRIAHFRPPAALTANNAVETGSVNAIVHIDIGNGNVISSTISIDAVKELGLAVGKEAYAIIKATSVMVGVE